MGEDGKVFKISPFGGFKKTEVLDYIEQVTSETNKLLENQQCELSSLEKQTREQSDEIKKLKSDNQSLYQRNEELLERLGIMSMDEKSLKKRIDETSELTAQIETLRREIETLHREKSELQVINTGLLKQTEDYRIAKEKLADIEICAYRRAKQIEERALLDAKNIRMQTAQLVYTIKNKITATGAEYEEFIRNATVKVEMMKQQSLEILEAMGSVSVRLDDVIESEAVKSTDDTAPDKTNIEDIIDDFKEDTLPKENIEEEIVEEENGAL